MESTKTNNPKEGRKKRGIKTVETNRKHKQDDKCKYKM